MRHIAEKILNEIYTRSGSAEAQRNPVGAMGRNVDYIEEKFNRVADNKVRECIAVLRSFAIQDETNDDTVKTLSAIIDVLQEKVQP